MLSKKGWIPPDEPWDHRPERPVPPEGTNDRTRFAVYVMCGIVVTAIVVLGYIRLVEWGVGSLKYRQFVIQKQWLERYR